MVTKWLQFGYKNVTKWLQGKRRSPAWARALAAGRKCILMHLPPSQMQWGRFEMALLRPSEAVDFPFANCAILGIVPTISNAGDRMPKGLNPMRRDFIGFTALKQRLTTILSAERGLVHPAGLVGFPSLIVFTLYHTWIQMSTLFLNFFIFFDQKLSDQRSSRRSWSHRPNRLFMRYLMNLTTREACLNCFCVILFSSVS